MIMFDPLDRPIPSEDNDQAIKQKNLLKLIKEMHGIYGENLENPLNYTQNAMCQQM